MFYALSSVGAFTKGARNRRKEIRSERAAIREEFERWRKNNPYATAAEFHAKVKQLGSTTPGGGVALPDHYAIQQMAAENQRQKQMVEEENERVKRLRQLNILEADTKLLQTAFTNKPDADITAVLNSYGMEVNEANVGLAQRAQIGVQTALQENATKLEQARKDQERREILTLVAGMNGGFYSGYDLSMKVREAAQSLGYEVPEGMTLPEQKTVQPPSQPASTPTTQTPQTFGPAGSPAPTMAQAAAPEPAPVVPQTPVGITDQLRSSVTSVLSQIDPKTVTPQALEQAIVRAQAGLTGGMMTPDVVGAAFAENELVANLRKQARQNEFNAQLDAARDVKDLFAQVEGQSVGLEAFLSTAANASGALEGLYIPPGSEAILTDVLGDMLRDNAGETKLKGKLAKMSSSELQAEILSRIDDAGFVTIDQMKANRAEALMQAPELGTTEDLFPMLDENLFPDAADAITAAKGFANAKELRDTIIEKFEKYKAIALNGRAVDQYALDMYHPADVLPRSELPRYREVMGAYFDSRIQELKDLDLSKVQPTPREQANNLKAVAQDVAVTDGVTAANAAPVGRAGVEALLEMGRFGFDIESPIMREDGQVVLSNPFQPTEFEEQLRSENGPIIASAIKAALVAYLGYDAEMPDATGLGVLTSAAGRAATNWRTRVETAKDAAEHYMLEHGIDRKTAKELAQQNRNIHSQIFIRNSAALSDQEAKDLLALLDAQEAKPDYEVIITK